MGPLRRWARPAGALAAVAGLAWLGLIGFVWTDYETEAAPAYAALLAGDWGGFLARCPAYGGALVLRAPFAFATGALGGGEVAVFRVVGLVCLAAGAVLGLVLARRSARWGWLALALCAANPVTLAALDLGHPEELLGAALCVGAVLAAIDGRALPAGALLGCAVATKAWGVLAIGPVLLALPAGPPRVRMAGLAAAVAGLVLAPLALAGHGGSLARSAASTGPTIFQPYHLFWWLGDPGSVVIGGNGLPKPAGWRTPPGWLSPLTHPLIALVAIPASLAWSRTRRPRGADVLLLLAILFAARCVLDPWNTVYYALPLLLTLTAWEVLRWPGRPPVVALSVTAATWATFEWAPRTLTPDGQALIYLAWFGPFLAGLVALAWPLAPAARAAPAPGAPAPALASS